MKKLLITLLAVAVSIGTLSAKIQIVSFGINTGVGQTKFKSSDYGDVNSDLGFSLGASMGVGLSSNFCISPELQYTNNHFEFDGAYSKIVNHYLSIPIVARFTVLPFMALEAGPRFTIVDKTVLTPVDAEKSKRNGDLYEKVGYVLGARVKLGKISVGARFNGQFSKHDSDTFGNIGSHSYTISVGFNL